MTDWKKQAEEFIGNLPSPHAPNVPNKDYATAVKLATYSRFGGIASPQEAEGFHHAFTAMNQSLVQQGKPAYSPEDYKAAVDQLALLSYAYHNRPPTMREIATYGTEHPTKQRDYFASLPDQNYPHMTAGQAVKMTQAAAPHAMEHMGRGPVKSEVAYLVHSGEHPADYYPRTKQQGAEQGAVQTPAGGNQRSGGAQTPGGQSSPQ